MNLPLDITESAGLYRQLLLTVVVLVGSYVLVRVFQRTALRFIDEPHRRYRVSKLIGRIWGILTVTMILVIWSPQPSRLVTILSVIGAGLAIANREAILSLAGRLNIALRGPYVHGDRIEVNGVIGDVIDIRLIQTSLMEVGGWVHADQSTGRIVHIPNSWVLQFGVYNYTQGFSFIWNELAVTVTFDSDWEAAREILLSLAQETAAIVEQQVSKQILKMSREYLVHYSILTPFVYVRVAGDGICLNLRYLCEVRKRRGTEHALSASLLKAFREHGNITLVGAGETMKSEPPPERRGPLPRTL